MSGADQDEVRVFTPGRVNLIGEHLDYNGGKVMPVALKLGLNISARKNSDGVLNVSSTQFNDQACRAHDEAANGHWSDHVLGAVKFAHTKAQGFDIRIESTLPYGSGLSSSAALSVGVIKAVRRLSDMPINDVEAALLAQRVEHEFIDVPCGIMDQMAVSVLDSGDAMILDTESREFRLLEIPRGWRFAVHHSGVVRSLDEGRYGVRRAECEAAARTLHVDLLCHLEQRKESCLGAQSTLTPEEVKRTRHVLSENARVKAAANSLEANSIEAFGALMNESHVSMRDDFEISTPEVDAVVEASQEAGAFGARMTGGGFGGCIVSLVSEAAFSSWNERLIALAPDCRFIC